jgi:V8-like Glu-specific endopeptidase
MKRFLTIAGMAIVLNAQASIKVIYGEDNRKDFYETTNELHKKIALSTAAVVGPQFMRTPHPRIFDLFAETLEEFHNICSTEAFSQQPAIAKCSAFLVGPDIMVTAGHCFINAGGTPEEICKTTILLFDFHMKSKTFDPKVNIPLENIHVCKEVIAAELNDKADYAVFKLDRPVFGREPLKFRTEGIISNSTPLVVVGHPSGIPTKIADGGKVTYNRNPTRFSTNLDTFQGNSGSAVFDADTGIIEGILIQGKTDYIPSDSNDYLSCKVVNQCDNNGFECLAGADGVAAAWGETVLRISEALPAINKALNPVEEK